MNRQFNKLAPLLLSCLLAVGCSAQAVASAAQNLETWLKSHNDRIHPLRKAERGASVACSSRGSMTCWAAVSLLSSRF